MVAIATQVVGLQIQPDEEAFWRIAGDLRNATADWGGYESILYQSSRSLVVPLSWLRAIPGPSELYARLFLGLTGAASAAAVTQIGVVVKDYRLGLPAGLLVALWPAQIIFSTSIHRDGPVWLGLAVLGLVIVYLTRGGGWRSIIALWVAFASVLAFLFTLRPAMGALAGAAFVAAVTAVSTDLRKSATTGSLVVLLAVPLFLGFGVGGTSVVLSDKFVEPRDLPPLATDSDTGQGETDGSDDESDGQASRTPDEDVAADDDRTSSGGANASGRQEDFACSRIHRPFGQKNLVELSLRTLHGAIPVMFGPLPWQRVCSVSGTVAKVQTAFWIALFGAAVIGMVRRRVPLGPMSYGLFLVAGLWASMAYFERTIGTAFRHRQQIFWVIALFAAANIPVLLTSRDSISDEEDTASEDEFVA